MWDTRSQCLYWTDAMDKAVFMFDRGSGAVKKLADCVNAVSVVLHHNGGLVLGGGDGFFYWHPERGLRLLADTCEGRPAKNINDSIADPAGRIFGGQENYREDGPYVPGYLFRLDPDGATYIVEEGLHLANGMGFSPDQRNFYLTDTIERRIYRYDYSAATGAIRNCRVLIQLEKNDGLSDGLTVDAEGFIWTARWFGGGLARYDPDGKLERLIPLPVAQPSSVMFGGPDLDELYVTSAGLEWKSPIAPDGHNYTIPRGGQLFRLRLEVQGKPEFLATL